MKVKGSIQLVVFILIIFMSLLFRLSLMSSSVFSLKLSTQRIQKEFVEESVLNLIKAHLLKDLTEKELLVIYTEDTAMSSTRIYTGNPELDFMGIIEDVYNECPLMNLEIEIMVLDKSLDELQVHLLDKTGGLHSLEEIGTGELAELNYYININNNLQSEISFKNLTYQVNSVFENTCNLRLNSDNTIIGVRAFSRRW